MQVSRDRKNVVLSKVEKLSNILDTELTGTSRKNWPQLLGQEEILSSPYPQAFNYLALQNHDHHDHHHHHEHQNHQGHHYDHHHHHDHLWL